MCLIHLLGGAFKRKPEELREHLPTKPADLVKRAFEDVDPAKLVDYHTHIVGVGAGTSNAVNPKMLSWKHPTHRLKFMVYVSACGVEDVDDADAQYIARLVDLIRHMGPHGKFRALAFDKNYLPDGTPNPAKTEFYVSNDYVFDLAAKHPDIFEPIVSVNPYRRDALEELERCARKGARIIKWLPNAMGIDPADERCDAYYQKVKQLDMVILSHGGEEKAVEAEEDQKWGNPLRLRRPLEQGVKVIVAHCAGLGANEDMEDKDRKRRDNFDLFMRLMDEPRYEGLLFADISAMTQFNRIGSSLTTIVDRADWHDRLVNGSDYPLPAINLLIRIKPLVRLGYLDADEGESLKQIYDFNPLLFDFVLKRRLTAPGTRKRLPASLFLGNPALGN